MSRKRRLARAIDCLRSSPFLAAGGHGEWRGKHNNRLQGRKGVRTEWYCLKVVPFGQTPIFLPLISMPSGGWVPHPKGIHHRPLLGEMVSNRLREGLFVQLADRCR